MEMIDLLSISEFGQSVTIVTSLLGFLPQWITLYNNKSSNNISLQSWVVWLLTSFLTVQYAVVSYLAHGTGMVLVATTGLTLVLNLMTIGIIVHYRSSKTEPLVETSVISEAVDSIRALESFELTQSLELTSGLSRTQELVLD